jgi:hypothetical protein
MHELLLGVFLWIVPGKFVLVQPAAPVDKGNTEHFSAARHGRVCNHNSFRVANALAGFLNNDISEREQPGGGAGVSGRSDSRRLRRWCGSLQDGYGSDRDSGCMLQSGSCRQGIPDALGSLGGTQVRLAFLLLTVAESNDVRERTRLAEKRGRERVRLEFLPLRIAKNGDVRGRTGLANRRW